MTANKRNTMTLLFAILIGVFFACSDGDDPEVMDESPNESFDGYGGDYVGLWNSTTEMAVFTDVSISARVNEASEGLLVGDFFISSNFTSCCGSGSSDGSVTIRLSQDSVTSFRWSDTISGCTGTFTGSGIIQDSARFVIDIVGTDCDGDHVGTIVLNKR